MQNYYSVEIDGSDSRARFLGSPTEANGNEVDPRLFTNCEKYTNDAQELVIDVDQIGECRPLHLCAFDMLVVSQSIAEVIRDLVDEQDVQFVPARIANSEERVFILNALKSISCLDEEHSTLSSWNIPAANLEPGEHPFVWELAILRNPIRGAHLFRVSQWPMALIVSDEMRISIIKASNTDLLGIQFERVSVM
jgi:hypothetical protein